MDLRLAQSAGLGLLVLGLTVSGCALPGPVPTARTDSRPIECGRGVPAWEDEIPCCSESLANARPRGEVDTGCRPKPAAVKHNAGKKNSKPSSKPDRTRAGKARPSSVPVSRAPGQPATQPPQTPGLTPPVPEADEDEDDGEADSNHRKDEDSKGAGQDANGDKTKEEDTKDTAEEVDKGSAKGMVENEEEGEGEEEEEQEPEPGSQEKTAGRNEEELHEEENFKTDLLEKLLGLEDSRLGVFGWVEANFTANPRAGDDGVNSFLVPNSQANTFVFQQVYLVFEQAIRYRDQVDYGFRVDNLFGVDAQNFHDYGLLNRTFAPNTFAYDPVQFYGELHLPIGQGIDIRGGRFFALAGYETATAPGRPLLSTSDAFSFGAHPFTQFGVMTTWHLTDQIELYNGVVNGWNRWINEHYPWSYAGGFSWSSADERTSLTVTLNAGFTQFPRVFPPFPSGIITAQRGGTNSELGLRNSDTTLFALVFIHKWTDKLTMVVETDDAVVNHLSPLVPGRPLTHASYYGLVGWFLYEFDEKLTGVSRTEVFRDNNGLLTGFADNFYEATLGMIYKPVPWFWLRPEARIDWAQFTPPFLVEGPSDHGRSNYQFTFGFDAIFIF